MNTTKYNDTKNINSSSLLDLKAELLRKQQEVRNEKQGTLNLKRSQKQNSKKSNIWSKSNAGVRERAQHDLEAKQEEDNALEKSRRMLEAKTRAYDKLSSTIPDEEEDGNERFLVDFERKVVDKLIEDKHRREENEDSVAGQSAGQSGGQSGGQPRSECPDNSAQIHESVDPEEQWVDYTDSLGRYRKCLKKDLHNMKAMDDQLSGKKRPGMSQSVPAGEGLPELMSADMYKEKLRQQWEEQQQQSLDQSETHYANVQFDEVRDHGVAYYQFDRDTEKRSEQMDQLSQLREQTRSKRDSQQRLKKKRKAMMAARLLKVKQRKLIREGRDPSEAHVDISDSDDSDADTGGRTQGPEPLERDETIRQRQAAAPVREWDRDKEDLPEFLVKKQTYTETSWKEKLRDEREQEFAPPSLYQDRDYGKRLTEVGIASVKKPKPLDPMALLESVTVSSYVEPVKMSGENLRAKVDPMAILDNSAADVGAMIASIRQETTGGMESVTDIPLPADLPPPHLPQSLDTSTSATAQTGSWHGYPPPIDFTQPPPGQHETLVDFSQPPPDFSQPPPDFSQPPPDISQPPPDFSQPPPDFSQPPPGYQQMADIEHTIRQHNTHQAEIPQPGSHQHGAEETTGLEQGPQPAHYSSAPVKCRSQARAIQYKAVPLHQLPLQLPAPPTAVNIPQYPSQEEPHSVGRTAASTQPADRKPISELDCERQWRRQFQYQANEASGGADAGKLPFPAPYVQAEAVDDNTDPAATFDPTIPPPSMENSEK